MILRHQVQIFFCLLGDVGGFFGVVSATELPPPPRSSSTLLFFLNSHRP